MTKFSLRLSQISLALVVAFGAVNFTACGADESKAPQIKKVDVRGGNVAFYVISQDDDTILKSATLSGRNGKCGKYTASNGFEFYKDMETCKKGGYAEEYCDPIFNGQKLVFGDRQLIWAAFTNATSYKECPPKNGVWKIELETNFGTYAYELAE